MRCALLALLLAASSEPDQWVRLTTPHFELFTTAGEKAGREAILHFEQVRAFFEKASPVRFPTEFPVRIIVFRNKDEFRAYTPSTVNIAYYTAGPKRDYIAMSDASSESYAIAVHEYFHLIIRRSGLKIPVWLNEGLADVYSTLRPVRDGVAVGDLIPGRVQALEGQWLTFESLTSVNTRSTVYNEAARVGVFYGESWALAHMLFLAPDYSPRFAQFVTALNRGKTSDEACGIAYGKSSDQVFADLQSYFGRKKIFGMVFRTTLDKSAGQPGSSVLSEFESRLMLADLLAAINKVNEAKREYQQLEQLQPDRREVTQSLGYLALQARDTENARKYFGKAFAAGETDPQMCYQLAVLERDANQPMERIIPALERAIQSKPDYTDALLQLGLMKVKAREFEPAINTLMSIGNITPEYATPLFAGLAYAYIQTGDAEQARKHAETAKKWARNQKEVQGVEQLSSFIEARSKGPFAPHPGEKTRSVEGTVTGVECAQGRSRLRVSPLASGQNEMMLDLPDPSSVEFTNVSGGGALKLACGPQKPFHVVLDYAPASVVEQGASGVVRRMQY